MSSADFSPKLFISYSWTSPDHQNWVIKFAEELVSQGIQVILDVWDLKLGHDANAFMESMVSDPTVTRVLLICDETYARKSDGRSGGAGTEAQIITPEIYAKKDQDKFVAVVTERDNQDGKPYLPVYYRGRIYIDLSDPASYGTEFERVVRWAWGQPLHVKPVLGSKPKFLASGGSASKIQSSVAHRRLLESLRSGHQNAEALAIEYFETISEGLERFRIAVTPENRETFDEVVLASIEEFEPYRREIIEAIMLIARYRPSEEMAEILQRFLERLLRYYDPPENVGGFSDWDFDNYRFIIHELFLYCVAVFVQYEKFGIASAIVGAQYYWNSRRGGGDKVHNFSVFQEGAGSLEHRNQRLGMNRRSLLSDLLKERSASTGVNFSSLCTADFILYFRACTFSSYGFWWPYTLLYLERYGGVLEVFARARSAKYFERLKLLLGVADKDALASLAKAIDNDQNRQVRWSFHTVQVAHLMDVASIATQP